MYIVFIIFDLKFATQNPALSISKYIDYPISVLISAIRNIFLNVLEEENYLKILYPIKVASSILILLWRYLVACLIYWIFSNLHKNKKTAS